MLLTGVSYDKLCFLMRVTNGLSVTCNKIIYPLQFGFQENHSLDHALISMTETIKRSLDNKKCGCRAFFDLQKAFDTVHHKVLLSKLEHYGIRGNALGWFHHI